MMYLRFSDRFSVVIVPSLLVKSILFAGIFAFAGCSANIRPEYKPRGLIHPGPKINEIGVKVIDSIDNTAPLAHQVQGLEHAKYILAFGAIGAGVTHTVDTGQLVVSDAGPYRLMESPSLVVEHIFEDALTQNGFRVNDASQVLLEVKLLRFEFPMDTKRGETTVKIKGTILLQVTLSRNSKDIAKYAVLETDSYNAGLAMTGDEVENFVAEIISLAVEHTLTNQSFVAGLME